MKPRPAERTSPQGGAAVHISLLLRGAEGRMCVSHCFEVAKKISGCFIDRIWNHRGKLFALSKDLLRRGV